MSHSRFRVLVALALPLACLEAASLAACGAGAGVGGIHARMGYSEEGGLRVVDVPAEGAAALAGLRVDDRIVAIDQEPVDALTMEEVVERLRGPIGSSVHLDISRGGERLGLDVVREPYSR